MSNLQLELLKLYANDISDTQLLDVRRLLGAYFAEQATTLLDEWVIKEELSPNTFVEWSKSHNRKPS